MKRFVKFSVASLAVLMVVAFLLWTIAAGVAMLVFPFWALSVML